MENKLLLLFLWILILSDVSAAPTLFLPGVSIGPAGQCTIPDLYGSSVAEIAARDTALNNGLTGPTCPASPCSNPVDLTSIDEAGLKFTVTSRCSGIPYPHTVVILSNPKQPMPSECEGNPCSPINGQKIQVEVDYVGPNLRFERIYNSYAGPRNVTPQEMGMKWRHNYDRRIYYAPAELPHSPNATAVVSRADGRSFTFTLIGSAWVAAPDIVERLTTISGGFEIANEDDEIERYDTAGYLTQIQSRNGDVTSLAYDPATKLLVSVTGPDGRSLTFTRASNTLTMTDPAGRTYTYSRTSATDPLARLTSVSYPNGAGTTTRSYQYDTTLLPYPLLTGITDENETNFATWAYDASSRVISSQHFGGAERVDFVYNANTTTVTDAGGGIRTYSKSIQHDVDKLTGVTGGICPDCGDLPSAVTYDPNGRRDLVTDFNGNITDYDYDNRGLEIRRIEAKGTTNARTIVTQWHATLHVPVQEDRYVGEGTAGVNISRKVFTYNNGRLATRTEVDPQTSASRITTYIYYGDEVGDDPNLARLLKRIDGPRALPVKDVIEFFYATADSAVHKKRDLIEVKQWTDATNSLSTFIDEHDAHGRPAVITDPNGAKTKLEYHTRGWLAKQIAEYQSASPKETVYLYDKVGQLDRITMPDGAFLDYDYDAAHRLIRITDNLTNKIEYTPNLMSKRTAEKAYDPAGMLKRQTTAVYNSLSQLDQSIGGTGNTTRFTYDANGNLQRTIDPRDPAPASPTIFSENLYDALSRVRQVKDNLGGNTTTTYDTLDNPKTVTDPRGLITSYDYNGFSGLTQQVNPDSGTATYQYDLAGNLTSKIDAKGVTVTYQYDSLNRQTLINYPTETDVTLTYDQTGTNQNGKGRLTTIADESGLTEYKYDLRGNPTEIKTTRDGITRTVGYTYDGANRVSGITYPSGRVVTYLRDAAGRVQSVVTKHIGISITLASSITHAPFGPVTGYTLGSGVAISRPLDLSYRVSGIGENAAVILSYNYDVADNITGLTDPAVATNSQSLQYDNLNRLTSATGPYGTQTITPYDSNGNRNAGTTMTYLSGKNRLSAVQGGPTFTYDAAGNAISRSGLTLSYGQDNRPSGVTGTTVANYLHNALGERAKKVSGSQVTYYLNGLAGELLAELDSTGKSRFEYAYLEGEPLAMMIPEDPNADFDGDGMPNGWEVQYNLDATVNDAALDPDGDGLTNLQEFQKGTNPMNPDTDGDGFLDGSDATPTAHTASWFAPIQRFLVR